MKKGLGGRANADHRVHHHRIVYRLVFNGSLPLKGWRAIMVDGVRYNTLLVMDAGDDYLAIFGAHDMTGKDAIIVE